MALLLQPNKNLKEVDLRIAGLLLVLFELECPREFIDVFIHDLTANIEYHSPDGEQITMVNRLHLSEKDVLESLARLHKSNVFYVEENNTNSYRVYLY